MTVDVYVGDENVAIHLGGVDALLALRTRLLLPVEEIVSARVVDRDEARRHLGWRLGGTALPGRVIAGHYSVRGASGERAFWSTYRDPEVLLIETRSARPRYVVLQHPDRHTLAWLISERAG